MLAVKTHFILVKFTRNLNFFYRSSYRGSVAMTTRYGTYGTTKKPSSGTKNRSDSRDIGNSAMPKFLVKLLLDMPFIKRNIGKKPLLLHLSLKKLRGRLVVNIPTPPTDRIWFGFRYPPELDVELRPCISLGECEQGRGHVGITGQLHQGLSSMEKGLLEHLMSYMETRIRVELAKNFVYPNMGSKTMPYFKIPIWLDVQSPPTLNKEMLGLGGQ